MFMSSIISDELSLHNFLKQLNFDLYLTKPQLEHFKSIMNAMIFKGYQGKISDVAELASLPHRTSISRFLSNSTWNEEFLLNSLRSFAIDLIWAKSREKTKPLSKAISPIEKCSLHHSHLKGKIIYGHQIADLRTVICNKFKQNHNN